MISSILRDSFGLYRRFAGRFIVTAAAVFVVLDLVAAITDRAAARSGGISIIGALVAMMITVVGGFWVQGALVEAVRDVRDGRIDERVGELFQNVRPQLGSLILAGLIAGVAVGVGMILLLIPGLILLTRWIVLVPVIVIEKRRVGDAFGRSNNLVKGHGWDVFGLILLTVIITGVASGILQGVFSWLPGILGPWIGKLVAHSVVIPFAAIAWTLLYYRLAEPRLITAPEARAPTTTPLPPMQPPTPTMP